MSVSEGPCLCRSGNIRENPWIVACFEIYLVFEINDKFRFNRTLNYNEEDKFNFYIFALQIQLSFIMAYIVWLLVSPNLEKM